MPIPNYPLNEIRNEYKSGLYADQINTPEKLEHLLATLEKIAQKKYNFDMPILQKPKI